jgi:hypothetical protein
MTQRYTFSVLTRDVVGICGEDGKLFVVMNMDRTQQQKMQELVNQANLAVAPRRRH